MVHDSYYKDSIGDSRHPDNYNKNCYESNTHTFYKVPHVLSPKDEIGNNLNDQQQLYELNSVRQLLSEKNSYHKLNQQSFVTNE